MNKDGVSKGKDIRIGAIRLEIFKTFSVDIDIENAEKKINHNRDMGKTNPDSNRTTHTIVVW